MSSSSWQGSRLLRPSLEPVCPRLRSDEASYTSSGFQENGLSGTCFDPAELTGPGTKQGLVLWRPSHPWPEAAGSGGWLGLEVRDFIPLSAESKESPGQGPCLQVLQACARAQRQRNHGPDRGCSSQAWWQEGGRIAQVNITAARPHLTKPTPSGGAEKRAARAAPRGPAAHAPAV